MRSATGFGIALTLALGLTGIVRAQDEPEQKPAEAEAGAKDDKPLAEQILGTYTYVSGKRGSDEIPNDRLTGTVEISKDTIKLLNAEGEADFTIKYTLKPGEGEKPATLDMEITKSVLDEAEDSKAKGIVKLEGDMLTVTYDYSGGTPDGFDPDDDMQHMFVMKRNADAK